VSARVDLFLRYFSPFARSIMVEQDATQLLLKYYCLHPQAKLLLVSEAPHKNALTALNQLFIEIKKN